MCHLVPSKAHLPLAQVSSVPFVQRRERECLHVYVCVWAGRSTFTQLWKCVVSYICFSRIIISVRFQCVKCFFYLMYWCENVDSHSYATYNCERQREKEEGCFTCTRFFGSVVYKLTGGPSAPGIPGKPDFPVGP